MNKLALLLAGTLLLASSLAWSEDGRAAADTPDDLRYCLDLPTAQQIAKCSGEISAGSKGPAYSKDEVKRILSEDQEDTSASANDPSDDPATAGDKPDMDPLPETTESGSN